MTTQYAGETCVLAYSGGLDTSVAVAWLRETLGFEVVTCTGDLQGYRLVCDGAERLPRCGQKDDDLASYVEMSEEPA